MRSILLNLRSSDSDTPPDIQGRYTFTLDVPIIAPADHMIHCSLHNAEIPNSFNNINTLNNKLNITETVDGIVTSRQLELIHGNYQAESGTMPLVEAFKSLLNSTGSTLSYDVLFSNTTGRFAVSTVTANASVVFDFTGVNSASRCLGFSKSDLHTLATSVNLISDRVCDLSGGNHSLLVRSNLGATNILDMSQNGSRTSTLFTIPINAENYAIISYSNPTDNAFKAMLPRQFIDNFTIRITNQDAETLDFQGVHWSMSLRFNFVPNYINTHPIQETVERTRERLAISANLSAEIDRTQQNLQRLHEALPLLRQHVKDRRDMLISQYRERNTLSEDYVDV